MKKTQALLAPVAVFLLLMVAMPRASASTGSPNPFTGATVINAEEFNVKSWWYAGTPSGWGYPTPFPTHPIRNLGEELSVIYGRSMPEADVWAWISWADNFTEATPETHVVPEVGTLMILLASFGALGVAATKRMLPRR